MSLKDTVDGINEAAWDRAMAKRDYFDFAVEGARRVNAAIQQAKRLSDHSLCPSCGGSRNETDLDDETCGSPHCREHWYGEVAERH